MAGSFLNTIECLTGPINQRIKVHQVFNCVTTAQVNAHHDEALRTIVTEPTIVGATRTMCGLRVGTSGT